MAAQPTVIFQRESSGGRWQFRTEDFGALREALGADVLAALCRCFVHADRLNSLTGFVFLSEGAYGKDSAPFNRDLQTMVWFVVGTLRELAKAVRALRSAMKLRGILDLSSSSWTELRQIEDRWENDAFFRKMRDQVAFHVDPDMPATGIEALIGQRHVVLIEGIGTEHRHTFLRLGLESVFMGSEMDLPDFNRFMEAVGNDQKAGQFVEEIFVQALTLAGVAVEERAADAGRL